MYQQILVPWDGSPSSAVALSLAARIAARQGASVTVVHVHQPAPLLGNAPMYDTRFDAERRHTIAALGRVLAEQEAARSHVSIVPVFLDGETVPALVAYAEQSGPDLVVIATHGHGRFTRLWLGSVTDALVRMLHVPVLVIPGRDRHDSQTDTSATPTTPTTPTTPDDTGGVDGTVSARSDETEHAAPVFRRVLVPLDGSSDAETVLPSAAALTMPAESEFLLLQVVPPRAHTQPEWWEHTRGTDARHRDHDAAAWSYLGDVAESLRAVGVRATPNVVENACAAAGILEFMRDEPVDVIALAPRASDRLSAQLLGSVTDKVLRAATGPVLLHHHAAGTPRGGNHGAAWRAQHAMPRAGEI